jgi:hypothetical protein
VICAHVVAPQELRAPPEPALLLEDAETEETVRIELTDRARDRFAQAAESFVADRAGLAARHGARLARLDPEDDLVDAVERIVVGGQAS